MTGLKPLTDLDPCPGRSTAGHQRWDHANTCGNVGLDTPLVRPRPVEPYARSAQGRAVFPRNPDVLVDRHTLSVNESDCLPLPVPTQA